MHIHIYIYIYTHTHRSSCPEYAIAAYVLLPIVMAPFLAMSYLLSRNVSRHSVFISKGGNVFTRFIDAMQEHRETWTQYCGLGFFMAANTAYTEAKEHGEWKVGRICVCMC